MADPRIEAIFDEMPASLLREHLKTLCKHGNFTIEDSMGKIEIDGRNMIIAKGFVDLTQSDDSDVEDENQCAKDESEKDSSEEESEEENEEEEDEDDVPALPKQQIQELILSKKRNSHMFKCENCQEEFDIENNGKGDCWYHPGSREVDYESDVWDDHDDRIHGIPEYLENEEAYADGFVWTCCEELGSTKGCKNTRHKVMEEKGSKRARY